MKQLDNEGTWTGTFICIVYKGEQDGNNEIDTDYK